MKTLTQSHTPGPWKILPCPVNFGRHPFHDSRWIATADASVEFGHDTRPGNWALESGSLICEMRDGPPANAKLIASAPALLAALSDAVRQFDYTVAALAKGQTVSISSLQNCAAMARAAIESAID